MWPFNIKYLQFIIFVIIYVNFQIRAKKTNNNRYTCPQQTYNTVLSFLSSNRITQINTCIQTIKRQLSKGECPSNFPFLKNNGADWRPIGFKEWRDTRTFSNLKSTHCTLIILLIINLVTKKFK